MKPYFEDAGVTLYHGDFREVIPELRPEPVDAAKPCDRSRWTIADAIITDPPYAETNLEWDVWPDGWPSLLTAAAPALWCFGSLRMFWERRDEFAAWKIAQEIVWEKHNGSGPRVDRFRRVHEFAVQFYTGEWETLFKSPVMTHDALKIRARRQGGPTHWNPAGPSTFASEEGGPRLQRSVIHVASCHGYAVNETQKPEGIIRPLMEYSVPPGGLVLDPFAGSGTTLVVARQQGKRAIGIEKRESQCAEIVKRLAQAELFTVPHA